MSQNKLTVVVTGATGKQGGAVAQGLLARSHKVRGGLADLIAKGELEVPIAGVFKLGDVRDAFRELELRHTRGKVVLIP